MSVFATSKLVTNSAELWRICKIPRRLLTEEETEQWIDTLTGALSTSSGTMRLLPVQAQALAEVATIGGLLGPIQVGGGKTLIALLSPVVGRAMRPLLLVPAHLVNKTRAEMKEYARHWQVPKFLRIESYQLLGRPQSSQMLASYRPDLIIADECHYLKNKKAAVTKRVARYMQQHPGTRMVAMSGTITKRSLKDFAHISAWSLKSNTPLPTILGELLEWSDALDEKVNPLKRIHPGALIQLCNEEEAKEWHEGEALSAARKAFRRRLVETPGVVSTNTQSVDCSLSVSSVSVDQGPNVEWSFGLLRGYWITPDGWEISDAPSMWRHARELALGFYYRWNPRPPDWWLDPRQTWNRACRQFLRYSKTFDSEGQVKEAVRSGDIPQLALELNAWEQVRDQFIPNTEAVWLDDSVLQYCTKWMKAHPGIVWTRHTQFAERLALSSGFPYYGREGKDKRTGREIESEDGRRAVIASIASNGTGRNLQMFNRNLYTDPAPGGTEWEQSLGRTHRRHQLADCVYAEAFALCLEQAVAVHQAIADCTYVQQTQGVSQKLLYADKNLLSLDQIEARTGPQWDKGFIPDV